MSAENLMYFKTVIVNLWTIVLVVLTSTIYFYNIRHSSMVASGTNTVACVIFPILIVPGIVDSIVDIASLWEPSNLGSEIMISIMIVMILVALFGIFYVASYHKIMSQCVELSCYDGYMPLEETEDNLDNEDVVYENIDEDELTIRNSIAMRRTDWFAIMNLYLITNVIWGFVSYNLILTVIYIMRVWCIHDTNINRGIDVATASGIVGIINVLTLIYDWFVFRSYSYPVFIHYISFLIYALSLMVEFHKAVGLEEAVTFVLLSISSASLVVKIIAGIRFREARYKKTV